MCVVSGRADDSQDGAEYHEERVVLASRFSVLFQEELMIVRTVQSVMSRESS